MVIYQEILEITLCNAGIASSRATDSYYLSRPLTVTSKVVSFCQCSYQLRVSHIVSRLDQEVVNVL
jgi:hypothetical protein